MQSDTSLWSKYQDLLNYQQEMGFTWKFPEYERFKEGDQWPEATERTRNLPRPVANIIRFFINSKKSNVLNQTIKMVYTPSEAQPEAINQLTGIQTETHAAQGAKDYTDFATALWEDLDQDNLNDQFIEDAATNGTGFFHYYWDPDITGGMSLKYSGDLRGEVLDALNVFLENPQEQEIQRQPGIIISSRESVRAVREMAIREGVPMELIELIRPDEDVQNEGYDSAKHEPDLTKKLTLLTEYYRQDGEVCYNRSTRAVDLISGRPLTPESLQMQGQKDPSESPDEPSIDGVQDYADTAPERFKMTLYPIASMPWYRRKKCGYGIGEVEGIVPNQKAINFNLAMMLLGVQQTAWPKMLAKAGALRDPVTNEPGEIVVDYDQNGGDGIKYMQPPNFSGMPVALVDKVMELTRTTSGVNEVASGEPFTANMAASALIALQNQAKQPIENIQKRFYRTLKDVGKIWEQFFKAYYTLPRNMTLTDPTGQEETRVFQGSAFRDVEFKLRVDVGAGSSFSESLTQSILENLYDRQQITTEQYVELLPAGALSCKERLKQMLEQNAQQLQMQQMGGNTGGVMPGMQGGNVVAAQ